MSSLPSPIVPATVTTDPAPPLGSPRWSPFTKFLVGLAGLVVLGWLLLRFQDLVPPLASALILAYLLSPVVEWLTQRTRLPWGTAVALVYATFFVLLLTLLIVAGIAIERQVEGLYRYLVEFLPNLPQRLQEITQRPVLIGPFTLDFSQPVNLGIFTLDLTQTDWQPMYDQLLSSAQPALTQAGGVVGSLASGTATFSGWFFFVFIVSYYILHDIKNLVPALTNLAPEGYGDDIQRLAQALGPIWNAFLRGQVTIALSSLFVMGFVFTALGVSFGPVLGVLAALGEFIPVIGALIVTVIAVLIALFQPTNWLGLDPVWFAVVVLVCYTIWQQIQGNVIVPRLLGQSLKLHPAMIVVGAFIGANLAGILGLLLAAPAVATLKLFASYLYRKLVDLEPWPTPTSMTRAQTEIKWLRWARQKMAQWGQKKKASK